jgi:hypothetical protein
VGVWVHPSLAFNSGCMPYIAPSDCMGHGTPATTSHSDGYPAIRCADSLTHAGAIREPNHFANDVTVHVAHQQPDHVPDYFTHN